MITKVQTLRIICFLIVIALADQLAGLVLRKLYFTQNTGLSANLNYSLQDCKADILIFGNSRAQHHYDSRILSDCLQMSCFNAGLDGGHSILLPYAQTKVITERYIPKIIILEFYLDGIAHLAGNYDRLSVLLPYYEKYPELHSIIQLRSPYEKVKLLSAIYPFNSDLIDIIRLNKKTTLSAKQDFEGYVPLKNKILNAGMLKTVTGILTQPVVDTNMVIALKDIIRLCKEKYISLYIFTSPVFHNISEKPGPLSLAAKQSLEIILQNKVNYFDFSFDSSFAEHPEWFDDKVHLNAYGATKYSQMIGELIKKRELHKTNLQ